ncbi:MULTISPECIES: ABC transporter permease [Okeania]|uniref:ABC transporter permease n=1 Tax=Okeania hirsuta TaxID=1458930 RepID=A0A3N6P8A7_9CYAN|nr:MULTISPECIES: ABC transporter permease [Okeania]NES77099.1 ABC transporter permease [Okeania sp. SIO1H4]NET21415.1 ABC transporter permease [Okeania sp. SIO1H5]NET77243.1 ABC transporter permease [Okeania sp. SIO1F9]NET93921.1 ABC transporter permease [Okeania sp. SIO1H2]RQH22470.1 ABC transporter permease [Okeania hirsuta]
MTNINFFSDYLSATIRLSVPLAFAALGGIFSERSGILNIALEGMLLTGAFISAAVSISTENVWIGTLVAIFAGGILGLIHAYLCVSLKVNQLVSGLAINLAVSGLTAYGARVLFDSGTIALPGIENINFLGLKHLQILGILFNQDLLFYLLLLLIPVSTYIIFHTSWGLTLRAVGEYPQAAATAGISVSLVRYLSVGFSGCLASLGGVYLALVHVKFFTEGMSSGKGFIALAAIIFGRWHPVNSVLACLLFGATEALQLRVQAFNLNIPYQFLEMLPYVIALLALIGLAGKSTPPAALGKRQ